MIDGGDRKMFAPLLRNEGRSPQGKVLAILSDGAVTSAAAMADELLRTGLAVGTRGPVKKRIVECLDQLEEDGKVKRVPDGRYRAVRRSVTR